MKKYNLIIPIAGKASRFLEKGYTLPKPMIAVGGHMMIDLAMNSIDWTWANLIFIVREDHIREFSIDQILKQKFGQDIKIIFTNKITQGTLCTCKLAENLIDNNLPLWIFTPDICMPQVSLNIDDSFDGFLYTFKANNPSHSYCKIENNLVIETAEKSVIGEQANCGLYFFKTGHDFIKYSDLMIINNEIVNNEYYIAPIFNYLIKDGKKVGYQDVGKFYVLGTPEDVSFFEKRILPVFGDKPIGICSDHSGFRTKEFIKNTNINYIDFGCYSDKDCDYIDFLKPTLQHIQNGICDFAIVSCRTANGMVMAANKFDNINAVIVNDEYTAEYAIRHNAANVFCIPDRNMTKELLNKIILKLKTNTPDGGRFTTRLMKIG